MKGAESYYSFLVGQYLSSTFKAKTKYKTADIIKPTRRKNAEVKFLSSPILALNKIMTVVSADE